MAALSCAPEARAPRARSRVRRALEQLSRLLWVGGTPRNLMLAARGTFPVSGATASRARLVHVMHVRGVQRCEQRDLTL